MTDPLLEYLKSFGEWEREYLSQPVEYKIDPPLVNFEHVLGRNFQCGDCYLHTSNRKGGGCYADKTAIIEESGYDNTDSFYDHEQDLELCFKLSEKTREILNHLMREGDDLGIDVHPRYYLGILSYIPKEHSFNHKEEWFFCSREHIARYNLYPDKSEDIKLELSL